MFLIFGEGSELKVEGYIDSDFMFDVDDKKSTSGCILLYNSGSVSWKSFKQSVTADSTMKAKYIVISKAIKKVYWYKKFAAKLDVMPSDAIVLYYNNNDIIALAKEPRSHQKSKYIE